jgi:glucose-1-phosphate adenylyltransferase
VRVTDSLILGNDYYETVEEVQRAADRPAPIGIGDDTVIRHAIVDKNARIGRGVRITNEAGASGERRAGVLHPEGIVIVPKNAAIADGTVI